MDRRLVRAEGAVISTTARPRRYARPDPAADGRDAIEGGIAARRLLVIRNAKGGEIGRGLVTYDAVDAAKIVGRSTKDIEALLGFKGPDEIIHRDDMALGGG